MSEERVDPLAKVKAELARLEAGLPETRSELVAYLAQLKETQAWLEDLCEAAKSKMS